MTAAQAWVRFAIEAALVKIKVRGFVGMGMSVMKNYRTIIPALVLSSFVFSASASAQNWAYKEVTDKFTDKQYVIATNNGGARPDDLFKVSFECRNKRDFVFTLDTGERLGDKQQNFELYYRADGKKTQKVRMVTFTNSNTGGMNKTKAVEIANDFLNADSMIVRAVSADKDEYDAEISLAGAYEPIVRAVVACGMSISG